MFEASKNLHCTILYCISADPCRQQGERVRGGLTSNKGRKEKIRRPGPQGRQSQGLELEKARFEASF